MARAKVPSDLCSHSEIQAGNMAILVRHVPTRHEVVDVEDPKTPAVIPSSSEVAGMRSAMLGLVRERPCAATL